MPKIQIDHDELAMDGRVKTVRTEFETAEDVVITCNGDGRLVRLIFDEQDGGGTFIVATHALRTLNYGVHDQSE